MRYRHDSFIFFSGYSLVPAFFPVIFRHQKVYFSLSQFKTSFSYRNLFFSCPFHSSSNNLWPKRPLCPSRHTNSEHHRAPQPHLWATPASLVHTLFGAEPLSLNLTFKTQHGAWYTQSLNKHVSNEHGEMNM